MSDKPENPPAFPMPAAEHSQGGHFEQYGMSLRDWFAGMALQGSHAVIVEAHKANKDGAKLYTAIHRGFNSTVAKCAYELADAMLAERAKEPGQ